ncbi:MAG: hypothetical protein LBP92_10785 [Deltaproteobacteria bacterium]|jgi:hypothetical protein|nr:hypothetical protein [Deltaproteobacteria bacterium]
MQVLDHTVQGLLPAWRLDLAEVGVSVASVFQMAVKAVRLEDDQCAGRRRILGLLGKFVTVALKRPSIERDLMNDFMWIESIL